MMMRGLLFCVAGPLAGTADPGVTGPMPSGSAADASHPIAGQTLGAAED